DKLHRHHGFQIHLSACPNGCSRPHIADIGFIRACVPSVDADTCTSCGDCAESCPDTAISMESGLPEIDFDLCMRCGHCVHICPVESMHSVEEGWRVLVGGRLGRHPKLAQELPGLFSDEQALDILGRALHLHMDRYGQRKRFGAVLDETGIKTLLEPSA
ncbi:MAG: 4Fe-4S binding protein, partial [Proteobacteria bacterium]|nr:4Fe-4S binding protein [Pseudomonadota bacterium]